MNKIEAEITDILQHFRSAASDLFEITSSAIEQFEKGSYAFATASPSKRMKNTLAIEREVAVVVSTFSDQQQRTIKFTKAQIDAAGGRLENTIAIILHSDPTGNDKLKIWGRENGLSILPIYVKSQEYKNGDIEKILCIELFSHDAFDVTGPVSDDKNFYGRREEALELARKLQLGHIRSCLGIRKIGKTSIINRVIAEMTANYNCISIMIDCSRDEIWSLSPAGLFKSISDALMESLQDGERYKAIRASGKNYRLDAAKNELEGALKGAKRPVIIVFDEVDYITPGSPTNDEWKSLFNVFWRNLRATFQEAQRNGAAVSLLIGGVSAYWFAVEQLEGVENAALAFVPEEHLLPMPAGATSAMVKKIGRSAGLQFDDDSASVLANATGNIPYWTRKCGSFIHRALPIDVRPITVNADVSRQLSTRFIEEEGAEIAKIALQHLFRVHPGLAETLELIIDGKLQAQSNSNVRSLKKYGILNERLEFSGEMFRHGFRMLKETDTRLSVGRSLNDAMADGPQGDQWAEEIAAFSGRFNVLERQLRDFTLYSIRIDAINNKKEGEIRNRVLAALPQQKRSTLASLGVEDLGKQLTWKDLCQLIVREWHLFEVVLGDKSEFARSSEILNDRPHAHAKDVDAAGFALYRRELDKLEAKLKKLH